MWNERVKRNSGKISKKKREREEKRNEHGNSIDATTDMVD